MIDALAIESDGRGWKTKAFLYCVEVICPESGWKVPLIPSLIISHGHKVIAELRPDSKKKCYDIAVCYVESAGELEKARFGTIREGYVIHSPDGENYFRVSLKTIRGDHKEGKESKNRLRLWQESDFVPRPDDIFQERLYCIQWMQQKPGSKKWVYAFRSVTADDLLREQQVTDYVGAHLQAWQEQGYIPDMVIEAGHSTDQLVRVRGWTYWHHLFNPRHLLYLALIKKNIGDPALYSSFASVLDFSSKLCHWATSDKRVAKDGSGKQIGGASDSTSNVFYNQVLNTFFNWGCRSLHDLFVVLNKPVKSFAVDSNAIVINAAASEIEEINDIYVTDPPYGDAVKYEEITEFFIAWLRKNPPAEFAHWTWDSRRALAIRGEDERFRSAMVAAYRRMAQKMTDNGLQILMFTHQSGTIWADMANIIWASGLQVTAAWYVVTETDSAIRQGANVKGTVILVLRKRQQQLETFRDDLGWEIEDAVKEQVGSLIGLDSSVRAQRAEGLYSDADLQMAGYAAALKVLTAYSRIDGRDMATEAEAPQQQNRKTAVDVLIDFAVQTAVQSLVPQGFDKAEWQKLQAAERFYLKMAEIEQQGARTLDNYQNFAKAFKVRHFDQLMSNTSKANSARLKLSTEFEGIVTGWLFVCGDNF